MEKVLCEIMFTKEHAQLESCEWSFIWSKMRTVAWERAPRFWETASRRQQGESGCMQCNKGRRQCEHQRSGIKLRNLAFYVWEDASLWAHWIHSFYMHLSYLGSNPVSLLTLRGGRWLLLAFPQLLSDHHGRWQHLLDHSFGSPHSHLEARNWWWLWHFLFIDMAGDSFFLQV